MVVLGGEDVSSERGITVLLLPGSAGMLLVRVLLSWAPPLDECRPFGSSPLATLFGLTRVARLLSSSSG